MTSRICSRLPIFMLSFLLACIFSGCFFTPAIRLHNNGSTPIVKFEMGVYNWNSSITWKELNRLTHPLLPGMSDNMFLDEGGSYAIRCVWKSAPEDVTSTGVRPTYVALQFRASLTGFGLNDMSLTKPSSDSKVQGKWTYVKDLDMLIYENDNDLQKNNSKPFWEKLF